MSAPGGSSAWGAGEASASNGSSGVKPGIGPRTDNHRSGVGSTLGSGAAMSCSAASTITARASQSSTRYRTSDGVSAVEIGVR